VGGRVAVGQIDASVDLGRLGRQPRPEDELVLIGGAVHEHPALLAYAFSLAARDQPLLQRHYALAPAPFRFRRNAVGELIRRGAVFVRIGEHADLVEGVVLDEGAQLVDVTIGLAREPDDERRAQRDAWYGTPDSIEQAI